LPGFVGSEARHTVTCSESSIGEFGYRIALFENNLQLAIRTCFHALLTDVVK
jgi:hypothetical protein